MTSSIKSVLGISLAAFVAIALALVFALPASAASISNPLFSNGQTSVDATGGATVSGTFTLTVGPGEVVEWLRTQSDPSQPFVDTSVGGQLGYQEQVYTSVPFSVKVPPNTGTYSPTVQGSGIFGGSRAINGGDSVVFGPDALGTVRVVATGGSSSDPVVAGSDDFWTKLAATIAAIFKANTPAPTPVSTACQTLTAKLQGTQMGVTSTMNGQLQGFLISEGMSIPLLQSNQAPFGFFGSQTNSAVMQYRSVHGC